MHSCKENVIKKELKIEKGETTSTIFQNNQVEMPRTNLNLIENIIEKFIHVFYA